MKAPARQGVAVTKPAGGCSGVRLIFMAQCVRFSPRKAGPQAASFKDDRNIVKGIPVFSPASTFLITFLNLYFANIFSAEATCHYTKHQSKEGENPNFLFYSGAGLGDPVYNASFRHPQCFQGLGQTPL